MRSKKPNEGEPKREVLNLAGQKCYASDSQIKMMGFTRKGNKLIKKVKAVVKA